ncbi:MAG TPA: glutathione S-transferase family protein [Candidatus Sulfotelmatobacter sp.]|nr:glutathione S-transferase family protein [Candidatus Sulfotelmatobacter sp.]
MLTFYFCPGASSMAPHIALHEVGAPFDAKPISLANKENRDPAYLAINPEGKVPTLLVDGTRLTEVAGILYWLARKYPAAKLWPEGDLDAEAQAISWMSFIAASVHPARGRGLEYATQIFGLADQRLGPRDWALARYSIADIHLFRLFWRFVGSFHPPRGSFPNLEAHYERMMARPAVKKTIEIESAIGYALP